MEDKKRFKVIQTYKNLYQRFIKIRGNPRQIASGFSLGIFIGMSPTMGLQIIMAVFFASLLKWNKISATIGVLITNAFTAPLLYALTYLVGAKVLGIENNFDFPQQMMSMETAVGLIENAPTLLWAMTVGGVIVGLPLAVVAYFAAYHISELYQKKLKDKIPKVRPKRATKSDKNM